MEAYFFIILIFLTIFAVIDLTVGVANDAVNFLNAGWGSKAASFRGLMITASIGVFVGTLFAGGMMEVARTGAFHPQFFLLEEVLFIYFAVMLCDILLLDFYNTLGLPTSTTVSLVSELLGAAFAFSVYKISQNAETMAEIGKYINTDKAFAMISAIFISVGVAFFVGLILQGLARLVFSFSYQRYSLIGGSIFGGLAFALISYFIFFKGMKSAAFISKEFKELVNQYIWQIEIIIIVGVTLLFILLQKLFKINVFKVIVLYGTLALAMSFSGNDLVNFIGPTVAGWDAYTIYHTSGSTSPENFYMADLAKGIPAPTLVLLGAGVIMAITLWTSKKAKTVIRTSVDLSRQGESVELFQSNAVSRALVRIGMYVSKILSFSKIPPVYRFINKRFAPITTYHSPDGPAFDMIRAAVSLTVASVLIAFATSLKLPLSTTYVTFMVAMGASLADRAWDRESAVYRVSGVITVIGGWLLTVFIAFTFAALVATTLIYGKYIAVVLLIIFAVVVFIRSRIIHSRREKKHQQQESVMKLSEKISKDDIFGLCKNNIDKILNDLPVILDNTLTGINKEELKYFRDANQLSVDIDGQTELFRSSLHHSIAAIQEKDVHLSEYYLRNTDLLRDLSVSIGFITEPVFKHFKNFHKNFVKSQKADLELIFSEIKVYLKNVEITIKEKKFENISDLKHQQEILYKLIYKARVNQIDRIRRKEAAKRANLLFLNILTELQNIVRLAGEIVENEMKFTN